MKTPSQKSKRGFTIIELLVSMAITLVIMLVLTSVTSFAVDAYRKSRNDVRQARIANVAIEAMADDLQSLVYIKGLDFNWLFMGDAPSGTGGPAGLDSPNPTWLIFASAVQDRYEGAEESSGDHEGGDVCLINYQLLYRDPITQDAGSQYALFSLYRQRIDPRDVIENELLGTLEDDSNLKGTYEASSFANDIDSPSNFLVENVYSLTVTLVGETLKDPTNPSLGHDLIRIPYQATGGGAGSFSEVEVRGNRIETIPADSEASLARIRSIEISMTILTDEGSTIIQGNPAFDLETILDRYSRQYTRTVYLPTS